MAPVKRSATAQRETRTTRAAAVAKEQTKTAAKKVAITTSATTDPAPRTRRSKKTTNDEQLDEPATRDANTMSNNTEVEQSVGTRKTRATAVATGLAAAPRRRLKITPLDKPEAKVTDEPKSTRSETKQDLKTSDKTRSEFIADGEAGLEPDAALGKDVKKASKRKASSRSTTKQTSDQVSAPKSRGRPKSQKQETVEAPVIDSEPKVTARTTRSKRAASAASLEMSAQQMKVQESKPTTGVRKKVTFQDLPNENDKENQPLPQSKAKKGAVKQTSVDKSAGAGLRAKPLRKTISSASNLTRNSARGASNRNTAQPGEDKQGKRMPQILTPKKITQVAKSISPEHEDQETSDGEDELHGSKTPIRDLSVSPRRPTTVALTKALSPAKKLDFSQSLVATSPNRTATAHGSEFEQTGILTSPARRHAASPFKEGLKDSPKRGLNEGAKWLFPVHNEQPTSMALSASLTHTAGPSTMLQSPKRIGALDSNFFSQSAMKKSVSKSPFKASLLGSPAKRLFSPTKKSATSLLQTAIETEQDTEILEHDMEIESEITASSHFRSTSSPLRTMRVEPDTIDVDFDESILEVRSPLKVRMSPSKQSMPSGIDAIHNVDDSIDHAATPYKDEAENVAPIELHSTQQSSVNNEDVSENQNEHTTDDTSRDVSTTIQDPEDVPEQGERSDRTQQSGFAKRPSLSQILFRSTKNVNEEESSEDELAGDATPVRSYARHSADSTKTRAHLRTSTGVPASVSGKGYGFTPLAAQMSGWLASSPGKSPEGAHNVMIREGSFEFSPAARQHIDGEVVISRDSTPVQKLNKRASLLLKKSPGLQSAKRNSSNLRKSLNQRQSIGTASVVESPEPNHQFEEYMDIRLMEEQAESENMLEDAIVDMNDDNFTDIMNVDGQTGGIEEGGDTILEDEDESLSDQETKQAGDLTTDLINFTHASDTAMVDFQKLAEEADGLAEDDIDEADEKQTTVEVDEDDCQEKSTLTAFATPENDDALFETRLAQNLTSPAMEVQSALLSPQAAIVDEVHSPVLEPIDRELESPSMLVIDQTSSPLASPCSAIDSTTVSPFAKLLLRTPQPNLRLDERRIINTVVSKVPLKPEGSISPIKMPKKRSRSFGSNEMSPPKRLSLQDLGSLPTKDVNESPGRRVRTSVAPSPGGTSTPAIARSVSAKSSRYSLGVTSTPGQVSFSVDDFGDSTLDGIELPEDSEFDINDMYQQEVDCASTTTTPKTVSKKTPATARRGIGRTATPMTATKTIPRTASNTPGRTSTNSVTERTPLEPIGKGALHGATVFVDVHTSEGADASGIFIELLNQMGAKCVKEWRWNPRASLAHETDSENLEQRTGITHVVYKDGGKRTLEKVRDAKGEVCCVGVAWVLDCERENKWLDESQYTIDTSIFPRGGSKRRKSMEPRALLISNDGSISTSRARRSVSNEMNELMKRELVNTPSRNQKPIHGNQDEDEDDDENADQATPTGYISYDPRTAMTPGTPYLVSQGKKLVQMSAPPKQQNKSLFEDEDEENDDMLVAAERGNSGAVKDAKKFRMKNLDDIAKRRRTFGWRPAVGSPLGKH